MFLRRPCARTVRIVIMAVAASAVTAFNILSETINLALTGWQVTFPYAPVVAGLGPSTPGGTHAHLEIGHLRWKNWPWGRELS